MAPTQPAQPATPAFHGLEKVSTHAPAVKPSGSPAPVCEVLRTDPPDSPDSIEKPSALCLPFRRQFFFAPLQGPFDRTRIEGHTKATSDGFDNALLAIGRLPPLLHEIQDLVRALMGAPRAALAWQQSGKTTGSKKRIPF